MTTEEIDKIRLSNVGISKQCLWEYDRNIEILSIPIEEVQKITLKYGTPVERPISQILVVLGLVGVGLIFGLFPLYSFMSRGDYPNTGYLLKPFCYASPMILLGGWYFMQFFQKKYFIYVETETNNRKIVFGSDVTEQEVKLFIDRANNQWGLNILKV
jgi:hypothetical protein